MTIENSIYTSQALGPDEHWEDMAACRNEDPNLFFPGSRDGMSLGLLAVQRQTVLLAQAICDDCTVKQNCLSLAQEIGAKEGIWGGISFDEITREENKQARIRTAQRKQYQTGRD